MPTRDRKQQASRTWKESQDKMNWWIECGDSASLLSLIPDASVDAVICDPPYPEINRSYGRFSESEWHTLMRRVVSECRRILNPTGSAVFILQPNSERVGRMRVWLWDFMAWTAREWNQVQDVWWWNPATPPTVHCHRQCGLMRPSVKICMWLGEPSCYRKQDAVLWPEIKANAAVNRENRALQRKPSGQSLRAGRCASLSDERGGVTPFNLLPFSNTDSLNSGGAYGHGASTPLSLSRWWVRYIVPSGGIVLDPFTGSGTTGIAAIEEGCHFVGIEREPDFAEIARQRLAHHSRQGRLF